MIITMRRFAPSLGLSQSPKFCTDKYKHKEKGTESKLLTTTTAPQLTHPTRVPRLVSQREKPRIVINMSSHHYKTGEAMPPLSPGVLRLYSMAFCPFAERTRLVLAAKGIDYELVNINTYQKPEWFFDKNPDGLVPVLEQDGNLIQESLVTCEYLDELYPKTAPQLPTDPYKRARDKLIIQRFGSKFVPTLFKSAKEKGANAELTAALIKHVEELEADLKARGTPYFSGSAPGIVDFALWPFIYRVKAANALGGNDFPESLTLFNQYVKRMCENELVAPRIMEDEALREFNAYYRTPESRFDEIQTKSIP